MSATATKPLPTAEQLKAYADQLSGIFRDVLSAFATANPRRKYGGDLAYETVLAHVGNRARLASGEGRYEPEELRVAIDKLTASGLLTAKPTGYAAEDLAPTPLGEELIAVLTGRRAAPVVVPDLPNPTW